MDAPDTSYRPNDKSRRDTIGKKVLRDFREFYRILWERRYPFTYHQITLKYFRQFLSKFLDTMNLNGEHAQIDG